MSTRSYIGIEHEDGKVNHIYCHYDGYLEGVGATLNDHYTTREQARALLALGDLSTLGDSLEDEDTKPYGDCPAAERESRDAYNEAIEASDVDFAYLLDRDGLWLYRRWNRGDDWKLLGPELWRINNPPATEYLTAKQARQVKIQNDIAAGFNVFGWIFDDTVERFKKSAADVKPTDPDGVELLTEGATINGNLNERARKIEKACQDLEAVIQRALKFHKGLREEYLRLELLDD